MFVLLWHCIVVKSVAWLISCSNEKQTFIVKLMNAGSVCLRLFLRILQKHRRLYRDRRGAVRKPKPKKTETVYLRLKTEPNRTEVEKSKPTQPYKHVNEDSVVKDNEWIFILSVSIWFEL